MCVLNFVIMGYCLPISGIIRYLGKMNWIDYVPTRGDGLTTGFCMLMDAHKNHHVRSGGDASGGKTETLTR